MALGRQLKDVTSSLTLPRWPLLSQRWLRRRLTVLRHAGLLFLRFSV
jgi:hypothetical protein